MKMEYLSPMRQEHTLKIAKLLIALCLLAPLPAHAVNDIHSKTLKSAPISADETFIYDTVANATKKMTLAPFLVGDCTGFPCLDGSSDGGNIIKLWAGTGSYWTALQGGAPAANRSWRLPIAAAPAAGATQVMTMDEYGQMAFMGLPDVSGKVLSSTTAGVLSWATAGGGSVSDTAYGSGWNGDTTNAPSKNAIYDKIETIAAGALPTVTEGQILQGNSSGVLVATSSFAGLINDAGTGTDDLWSASKITTMLGGKQAADSDLTTWAGVTPGTGVATALAVNVGSSGALVTNGGALGTPSGGTLTNTSGLPVSGITASTSTALGVGSVELGHASDTSIARVSAGVVSVEGVTVTRTIVSGSATFNPGSINSAACSSAVDGGTATGVATTDVIDWGFSGTPIAVTGYVPLAAGGVYIVAYPTADHVNFIACNNTAGAIDPGSVTLNWAVRR
jgi:hypothetical protein